MLGCLLTERLRQHSSTEPTLKDLQVHQIESNVQCTSTLLVRVGGLCISSSGFNR